MNNSNKIVTRFAPSPTGFMHLGHAYAALQAWHLARNQNGKFLLRIENIDARRCRQEFEEAIFDDLLWLGVNWDGQARRQSQNMHEYKRALDRLNRHRLLYPCFCTRKEILAEISQAGAAPHELLGYRYPGTCKRLSETKQKERMADGEAYALRLDVEKAIKHTGPLIWIDEKRGTQECEDLSGDVVLARKDIPTSYHLAVTVDDHRQRVNMVTRGVDLFEATHIHRLLQALLDLDTPTWNHHELITDNQGQRLSKRNRAPTIRSLRRAGETPSSIKAMIGFK
ncbi:MAG: tRNA glutamyl-Q(34) synthetase GluQRS [Pseudomonadota bacterium]|nr:tRNA glutamyl-Q(34) synthetase GluQRS [Pseudomonadota bacterium]